MDANKKKDGTLIMTPVFRLSYPNLAEANSFNGSKPSFSVVMLFPKKGQYDLPGCTTPPTSFDELKKAAQLALNKMWPDANKRPKNLYNPFRDGDVEKPDTDGYAGCYFISARSSAEKGMKVGCVKALPDSTGKISVSSKSKLVGTSGAAEDKNKIQSEFYAGCFCRALVMAYPFTVKAPSGNGILKQGVTFSLQHIQKWAEGEPFSGRMKVEDAFECVEGEDDPFAAQAQEEAASSFL